MLGGMAIGSSAAEMKVIELTDGSIITGEVLSMHGGVYTIMSGSLGTLTIDETKIRAIRPHGSSSSLGNAGQPADIKTLQDKMLSNAEVMGMIESLKDDPRFMKVLEDPAIMNAVKTGDIASLMANPKFLELLSVPAVQDIQKKVAK